MNENIKRLATKEEIKTLATKTKLKEEQNKIVKLQTYNVSLFISQSHFVSMEHNIVQPLYWTLKRFGILKKLYHGDLKVGRRKNLLLLPQLVIAFYDQLTSMEIQVFV